MFVDVINCQLYEEFFFDMTYTIGVTSKQWGRLIVIQKTSFISLLILIRTLSDTFTKLLN